MITGQCLMCAKITKRRAFAPFNHAENVIYFSYLTILWPIGRNLKQKLGMGARNTPLAYIIVNFILTCQDRLRKDVSLPLTKLDFSPFLFSYRKTRHPSLIVVYGLSDPFISPECLTVVMELANNCLQKTSLSKNRSKRV